MKKYVCYGGNIVSKHDHQEHFISAHQVAQLYKVNPDECYFVHYPQEESWKGFDFSGLIALYPRSSGDYNLPE